ncbi:rho gtpase-activating protein 18 [Lasius niger]|uniref:Rho gtpase-activating protein 18 n=1 Tax=Lasius niger TaxID=67767 RepID=A0A0J7KSH7_LASNI|nr:rho gtpase-activating protein 18 [Lasius niger]
MDRGHGATYAGGDNHLLEYWEEYQKMIEETKMLDDYLDEECSPRSYDEGEEEAEWLRAAGLGQLTEAWKAGREVQPEELGAALRPLSRAQAEAVKRRVRSLNHTVKQRFNQRQRVRKPDIRDVFKDVEVSSTGTRSRSATPDSLDSIPGATPENTSPPSPPTVNVIEDAHQNACVPSFVSIFHRNEGKATVRRTPSAPQTVLNSVPVSAPTPAPVQEIFRRTGNWSRGDVANDSEGIQLTGYHRLGTIHISRPVQRRNNGDLSDVANAAHIDTESVRKLAVPKESTLRDSQLTSEENNIPLVFQKILSELTKRGVKEEGILRVGGHKQKVEIICTELETDFYCKPKEMDNLFKCTPCHDLSAVLKRLLRDLPQPLLTVELIDAFYQSHGVKNPNDLVYSLNLLVLLLPVEHRCTLEALLNFLKLVIENQASNKMSIHNVAMIVAPSLFPPRYIHPRDRTDLTAQVNMAAICCQITEALLNNVDKLWYVPTELLNQLRRQSDVERYRKYKKKYY